MVYRYVDSICTLSEYQNGDKNINIRDEYIKKKRVILKDANRFFTEGYDKEFEFLKERWLCNEDSMSILTDAAFEYISEYDRVKDSKNVEKKMFENMTVHITDKKEEIFNLIEALLYTYLADLVIISDNDIEGYCKKFFKEVKKGYKFDKKQKCPDNRLDYRRLCSNKQYVIKLRKHYDKKVNEYLKNILHKEIERILIQCEEEYNETT